MATLMVQDGELVVQLSRWEKAGALHGDVRVPLDSVEDVSVSARAVRRSARPARAGDGLAAR